ncbi:hypothetical protein [Mesorhizobium australicum]|uniref:hypothetical protein n=1 Tax=Mesorhizobium australicum TaxID=536018 RepID=UPI00333CFA18
MPPPRPVVARQRPKKAGLGAPAPGIENRRRRLVHEQLGRLLDEFGRATIGARWKEARSTQADSTEQSSVTPLRMKACHCR